MLVDTPPCANEVMRPCPCRWQPCSQQWPMPRRQGWCSQTASSSCLHGMSPGVFNGLHQYQYQQDALNRKSQCQFCIPSKQDRENHAIAHFIQAGRFLLLHTPPAYVCLTASTQKIWLPSSCPVRCLPFSSRCPNKYPAHCHAPVLSLIKQWSRSEGRGSSQFSDILVPFFNHMYEASAD